MPNGVNFKIKHYHTKETKIVHHDRLTPVRENNDKGMLPQNQKIDHHLRDRDSTSSSSDSDLDTGGSTGNHSDFEPSDDDSDTNEETRQNPTRNRIRRCIPGAIPWSAMSRL